MGDVIEDEANEREIRRIRRARLAATDDWCDNCHGYTHMPWCSEYEESGTVPANATGMSTLEQAQALTRDWNQKSRFEQILIRHQIWGNSALPDDEYTASYYDVKVLIKEHAAQLRFLGNRAEELSSLLAGMTTERDGLREVVSGLRANLQSRKFCSSCDHDYCQMGNELLTVITKDPATTTNQPEQAG